MALQELALKKIRDLSELSNLSGYIPIDSSATGTRKFDASKLALAADVNAAVSSLRRDVNSNVASIAALRSRLVAVENKVAGALSYIGEASIAEIEAMRIIDIENGSMYTITEDGTIHYTLGGQAKTLEVEQYDEIAWGEKGWNIIGKDRRTDLSEYSKTSEFKPVAFSGDYNDLENKPTIPEVPVKEVTVGGQSVVNAQGTAEIPEIPTVPVKDVAIDGQSVVDGNGVANIPPAPDVPVQDVTVGGSSVLNSQGVAEIPQIPTVPVQDVTYGGQSVLNAQGVAEIPEAPVAPVQDVTYRGESIVNEQGTAVIPDPPAVPVQDVTVGGTSVLNSQGVAEIPQIPTVPVQDVTANGQSVVNEQGVAEIPASPVQDVTVGGQSVLNASGVAEIPQIPTVPVQDVTYGGDSVVNAQGVAEIPEAPESPVQDVTYGGQSVLNEEGVAEIPEAPEAPVQDVTYGGQSVLNAQGVAEIPEAPAAPVQDVTVGGTSVLNASGVAEIPAIPSVPVQDVTYGGQSVLNASGVAEIPEAPAAPVQDVTVGGTSVLNASGVAEIPQIPTVPVQDVTYGGQSVLNAQGVAEIPEAPESPVQDVTVGGTSVLNAQGVAEIPQIPTVPVQDVTYGGQSVLNAQGVAEIPEAPAVPVQDVTYGGQSVLNAQGVAEIPEAPAVPVQDVTVGGSSVLNAQGVAEIPQIPTVPVQDVTVGGTSVLNAQGTAEIPAIPDAQVQSDWNQQDNTKKDFIKNKPSMVGKVHFLKAVGDEHSDVRAPYGYWIVDLEKPNPESPYGYDYAMAEDIMAKLSAGEVFVLSTYSTAPSPEEDLFIMDRAQDQSREGHPAVRIWFTRMFASGSPEYMYFTTIYTPSMYNGDNNPLTGGQPEGRMAILNWRGDQSVLSEFRIMPYTSLASVATTGDYNDLTNKPTIPTVPVQDVTVGGTSVLNAQGVAEIPQIPTVPVQDVTVGGTSVLNAQGVAEIPAFPSPGLSAVVHDTTLNGNGTTGSPLSVRMEAVITQVTEDIEEAVDAVKSRIVYTVGLSAVDNTYNHNGSHDTNGVFAKGTLFNPPMDFDLTDETRIVFSTNQSAGSSASKLYFAIYQYDAASKSVNWVANTDNCISFVQSSGYQAGFHFARLTHMKDGLTKFSSGKLYYFVMFTDDTNFRIAGNTYTANMNTFNGGTNLGLGAYLNSVKTSGGATAVITDGSDIENLVPTINWEGEYLTRIFAAITNVTEAPFIDLGGNVLPTNVDRAGSLPNFTPAAKNCVFMRVTPTSNCDVVAIEWIDSMSTLANWAERNSIYSDDYSVWLGSGNTVTSTTTAVGASLPDAYRHELRFATPISLVANTNYKIECECFDSADSKLFSWSSPANYLEAYPLNNPPPTTYNNIIGKYLKITCLKDGVETSYVI